MRSPATLTELEAAQRPLSQGELANRLDLSTSWIRELTRREILPRNDDGTYPWPRSEDKYAAYRASLEHGTFDAAGEAYEAARARLTSARADAAEMENRVRRSWLVPADDVATMVHEPLEAVDCVLRTAPHRHAKAFALRIGISKSDAMALIHDIIDDARADLPAMSVPNHDTEDPCL